MSRPNDQRNFVHKRILGGIKGFVSSGFNPLAGLSGFISGGQRGQRGTAVRATAGPRMISTQQFGPPPPRGFTSAGRAAQPRFSDFQPITRAPARAVLPRTIPVDTVRAKAIAKDFKFPDLVDAGIRIGRGIIGGRQGITNGNGCPPPLIMSDLGNCIAPTSPRGAELFEADPILGQYGAGFIAGSKIVDVATCPRNTVLGTDGVCYNKKGFANGNRMWPAGRKPLLSGGDLGAIARAARAAKRLEGATKRLQKMGMIKKAIASRARAHQHARPVAAVSV